VHGPRAIVTTKFERNSYAEFSMDIGGVLEFYPSRRMIVRFDVGDTIVNRRAASFILTDGVFVGRRWNYATHNLQLGAGIGFRF
jgi:hypothetical protein